MFELFLILFLLLILGELLYLFFLWRSEQSLLQKDWQEAHSYSSAAEFITKNREWLSQIRFGFNLSPEHLHWVFGDEAFPTPKKVVDTIVDEWKLQTGRLSIRMNNTVTVGEKMRVHVDYYIPWLNELGKHNASLYLNAGIKAARWPEIHVPEELLLKLYGNNFPSKGHEITPNDPLGAYALQTYYPQFFSLLRSLGKKHAYPSDFFFAIQAENEPLSFFGPRRWKLSKQYVIDAMKIAHAYFPTAKLMQNSPISWGLFRSTNNVLFSLKKQLSQLEGKLLSGVNNYYKQPHPKAFTMRVGGESLFENLAFAAVTKQFGGNVANERKRVQKEGVQVMVSELQAEPWDPYVSPGNNFQEFLFILLRNKRIITFQKNTKTDVLVWGVEELLHNLENPKHPNHWHHQEIVNLMREANSL